MPLMGESSGNQRLRNKRTVTGNTTVQAADDVILVDATAGNLTVTLSLGSSRSMDVTIKKIDATNNGVTVIPTSPDTIDGKANYMLTTATMPSVTLTPSANGWYVL